MERATERRGDGRGPRPGPRAAVDLRAMQPPPPSLDLRTIAVAISGAALGLLAAWALVGSAMARTGAEDAPPPAARATPAAKRPIDPPPPVSAARAPAAGVRVAARPPPATTTRPADAFAAHLPGGAIEGPLEGGGPCHATSRAVRAFGSARLRPVHDAGRMLGLQILDVTDDTFWYEIGLASGDVIVERDGAPIDAPQASVELLREVERSDRLRLTVQDVAGDLRTVYWEAPARAAGSAGCP